MIMFINDSFSALCSSFFIKNDNKKILINKLFFVYFDYSENKNKNKKYSNGNWKRKKTQGKAFLFVLASSKS